MLGQGACDYIAGALIDQLTARLVSAGDLLTAKGFNVVGRVGVQNYQAEGGKLTKIAPKAPAGQQKNAQAATQH